jgi:O-antigen/teichoic acid export membrane protein
VKYQIAKSVFWIVWSRGGLQVVSLLSTAVLARLLSPADYGVLALAGIWTGTVAMLAELGLGGAIVQFPELKKGELSACFWATMAAAVLGYLAIFALAPSIAAWFNTPVLGPVLRVAALSFPLVALRTIPDSLLRKRLQFDKTSQVEVGATLISTAATLALAWHGAGVWALVSGILIQSTLTTIIMCSIVRWWPGFSIELGRLPEILRFSLNTLGARLAWSIYEQTDAFVLGKHSGGQVVGFYSMARFLATLPVLRISVLINSLAFPIMAGVQHDVGSMRGYFLRGLRLVASVTIPMCIGLAVVADDLVRVVLSEKWLPALPLLKLLCAYAAIHSLAVLFPPVLLARYRAGYVFWWTMALIVVMPFAFWFGAELWGAMGVALAWVVVYPLFMLVLARATLLELAVSWREIWNQLVPVIPAVLAMMGCIIAVQAYLPAYDLPSRIIRLMVTSAVGASVYGAWLLWSRAPVATEMLEVLQWVIGRLPKLPQVRELER